MQNIYIGFVGWKHYGEARQLLVTVHMAGIKHRTFRCKHPHTRVDEGLGESPLPKEGGLRAEEGDWNSIAPRSFLSSSASLELGPGERCQENGSCLRWCSQVPSASPPPPSSVPRPAW